MNQSSQKRHHHPITPTTIQSLLAEAFQLPVEDITPDLSFGDLPQWDSMGHMEIMVLLEEHFQVEITAEMISELTSIPAIFSYLDDRNMDLENNIS